MHAGLSSVEFVKRKGSQVEVISNKNEGRAALVCFFFGGGGFYEAVGSF